MSSSLSVALTDLAGDLDDPPDGVGDLAEEGLQRGMQPVAQQGVQGGTQLLQRQLGYGWSHATGACWQNKDAIIFHITLSGLVRQLSGLVRQMSGLAGSGVV